MKVGRNDPCPCGSGKKYKKCCHSKETTGSLRHMDSLMIGKMEEGYKRLDNSVVACKTWASLWDYYKTQFTPTMRHPFDVDEIYSGNESFANWSQDYLTELLNAAREDESFAEVGIRFAEEYLQQFPGDEEINRLNFRNDLSGLYCLAGRYDEGEKVALGMIEEFPQRAAGYLAMAEVAQFLEELGQEPAKSSLAWLKEAKAKPVVDGKDYDLNARIAQYSENKASE